MDGLKKRFLTYKLVKAHEGLRFEDMRPAGGGGGGVA